MAHKPSLAQASGPVGLNLCDQADRFLTSLNVVPCAKTASIPLVTAAPNR